jgi:hypothetical protein
MSKEQISIITGVDSFAERQILTGVIGTAREGGITVDPVLNDRIYALSMVSEAQLSGLQTQTIEIEAEHANAFRATMLANLGQRWAQAYDRLGGMHELAKVEGQRVRSSVADAIASLATPGYLCDIRQPFQGLEGVLINCGDPDDVDSDAEWSINLARVRSLTLTASGDEVTPWTEHAAEPILIGNDANSLESVATEQPVSASSPEAVYASGSLAAKTVIYGATAQARNAVLVAISSLPGTLRDELIGRNGFSLADVSWQSHSEIQTQVRAKLLAGEKVAINEVALLAPDGGSPYARQAWAEGALAMLNMFPAAQEEQERSILAPQM